MKIKQDKHLLGVESECILGLPVYIKSIEFGMLGMLLKRLVFRLTNWICWNNCTAILYHLINSWLQLISSVTGMFKIRPMNCVSSSWNSLVYCRCGKPLNSQWVYSYLLAAAMWQQFDSLGECEKLDLVWCIFCLVCLHHLFSPLQTCRRYVALGTTWLAQSQCLPPGF